MSQLISTTRITFFVVPALCLIVGCNPVVDSTRTPLPTSSTDETPADDPAPKVDVVVDDDTGPVEEPAVTEPTEPDPTDAERSGSDAHDTSGSDTSAGTDDPATSATNDSVGDEGISGAGVGDTESLADPGDDDGDVADVATDDQVLDEPVGAAVEAPSLTIGSVAPPLQVEQWIIGEEVGQFKEGHVYVVEFWATWCGPCRTSMPHLSQLQEDHRAVATFIGITREDEGTVREFMATVHDEESGKTWDEIIQYTIALDHDNQTNAAYMRAAEQTGIPTAFIVGKDGVVEWIGHPMSIDEPIAKVLSDDWDREAALAKLNADRAVEQAQQEVSAAAHRAKQTGDWTEVLELVEKMVLKNPESAGMKIMQFNVLIMAEKYEDLTRVADELSAQVWDDANYLNRIAWQIVTRVPKEHRDLQLALKIALRSNELAEKNPSVIDTVARVYYEMGDRENAIQWQKRAVELAPDEKVLQDALEKYEAD